MAHHPPELYNETHQSRTKAPTNYESLLGDSIERAFGSGIQDLDGLIQYLNTAGPSGPNGQAWTPESYKQEMARLAA